MYARPGGLGSQCSVVGTASRYSGWVPGSPRRQSMADQFPGGELWPMAGANSPPTLSARPDGLDGKARPASGHGRPWQAGSGRVIVSRRLCDSTYCCSRLTCERSSHSLPIPQMTQQAVPTGPSLHLFLMRRANACWGKYKQDCIVTVSNLSDALPLRQ